MDKAIKVPFVDWATHTALCERMAIVETLVNEKLPSLQSQVDKALKVAEDTNNMTRDHISNEDKTWGEFRGGQKDLKDQVDKKFEELKTAQTTVKKSTLEKYFYKSVTLIGGGLFAIYYLLLIMKAL
jgi:hypothetical protein